MHRHVAPRPGINGAEPVAEEGIVSMDENEQHPGRRKIAKALLIGGAVKVVTLPSRWAKPLVATVLVPAHALASPYGTTPIVGTTAAPVVTTLPPPPTTQGPVG